jgi:hypothetical protein
MCKLAKASRPFSFILVPVGELRTEYEWLLKKYGAAKLAKIA